MDGETGESMEEEEETDVGNGVSEAQRLVRGCRREIGKLLHYIKITDSYSVYGESVYEKSQKNCKKGF